MVLPPVVMIYVQPDFGLAMILRATAAGMIFCRACAGGICC